jgi:hypothetical protein
MFYTNIKTPDRNQYQNLLKLRIMENTNNKLTYKLNSPEYEQFLNKLKKHKWEQEVEKTEFWFDGDWNNFYWIFISEDKNYAFEIVDNPNNSKDTRISLYIVDKSVQTKRYYKLIKNQDFEMTITEAVNLLCGDLNIRFKDFTKLLELNKNK